ncbi:MAG: DUF4397 domain-containing protein [Gemmatimonadales bacterium]
MRFRNVMAALVFGAILASCGEDPVGPVGETARLRLVNGSPAAPAVDLRVDGTPVLSNVSNAVASEWVNVPEGSRGVALSATGATAALDSVTVNLVAGSDYTMFVTGITTPGLIPSAADTGRIPAPGKVKVRLVHAAPNGPAVDVYLTQFNSNLAGESPVIFPFDHGVGISEDFPGYIERDPGIWQVSYTARGTKNLLLHTSALDMEAGEVLNVMLINGPEPDSTAILGVSVVGEGTDDDPPPPDSLILRDP